MCVCALFIGTATLHVCMCACVLVCVCVCPISFTEYNYLRPQNQNQNFWLQFTVHIVSSSLPSHTLSSHLSPFLTNLKAPRWPLQAASPSPTNYWSSFILLRAEPAWNHSICVSLKLWLRVKDSWLPSLCLITAVRGLPGAKDGSPMIEILSSGRILS